MEANVSVFEVNVMLGDNVANSTNVTSRTVAEESIALYESYFTKERLVLYRSVAYLLGTLIILSNLTVVISSGLMLRKGQQPKITCLLLGNVSLADMIIGISMIFSSIIENSINTNSLCIFQIGMIVCPTLVSIFSVGLIAIDRYIYIIHGLYYQRWINTTRIRNGILVIWLIGVILGFLPATGWINREQQNKRCYYGSLFPDELILFNSIISIIPIALVAILYTIILVRALKNAKNRSSYQSNLGKPLEEPKLRINRTNAKSSASNNVTQIKRSSSTSALNRGEKLDTTLTDKTVGSDNYKTEKRHASDPNITETNNDMDDVNYESELSVWTVETDCNSVSNKVVSTNTLANSVNAPNRILIKRQNKCNFNKEPSKYRAIIVVMLMWGSVIITWVPFSITIIFYVFCDNKIENPKCLKIGALLAGPLTLLAYTNSILNPLIYAWWHRGFQKAVKAYFIRYFFRKKDKVHVFPTR